MVDREEVARLAGVSSMTVTRVVSGKGYVAEKTRRRVQKVIEETGYIPNRIASGLVSRKSNRVAIIVPELSNPYYLQVVEAMIREAKKYGYILSVFKAYGDEMPEVLEEVISNRVAGVVNYSSPFPERYKKMLKEIGAKLIRADDGETDFRMTLSYDGAIREALDLLLRRGAEKILFVAGVTGDFAVNDRRIPYFCEYMAERGRAVSEEDILGGEYPIRDAFAVGQSAAERLLKSGRRADAVLCLNDMMALGFMNAWRRGGKRIPEDTAVMGFDNIRLAEAFDPELSTVATDTEKEARLYVEYIAGVGAEEDTDLHAKFIARRSTQYGQSADEKGKAEG